MHEVLAKRLGQSLPRKSVVRLTDSPDMTLDVYRESKTTIQPTTTTLVTIGVHGQGTSSKKWFTLKRKDFALSELTLIPY